jgi:hypothetical protein
MEGREGVSGGMVVRSIQEGFGQLHCGVFPVTKRLAQ